MNPRTPRILISCGEPSGDFYGGELIHHLRMARPGLTAFGLGGDHVLAQGAELQAHVRDVAVVGLFEVVKHLGDLRGVFNGLLAAADRVRPDVAVLIDYPDFNLRLARALRRRRIPVVYYVSPQLWAWRGGRMRSIRENVARMLVLFPFEETLYRDAGVPVTFVGHPLVEHVKPLADRAAFLREVGLDPGRPVIALLPGSRKQEVAHNLPPLAGAVRRILERRADAQFLMAAAPNLPRDSYDGIAARVVRGRTHEVLGAADVGLVASGTATIEAALLGLPMVVVYRLASLTYALGRPLMRVKHFAMVNLIAGREVVPELIQADFTPERVAVEALGLLENTSRAETMRADLAEVRRRLGGPGASARAATAVETFLPR